MQASIQALKSKLQRFFSQFKKPKKDSRKLPKAKRSSEKGLRVLLWALLLLLVIASPLAFIRSGNALLYSKDNTEQLKEVQASVGSSNGLYSREEIEVYGDQVVDAYIHIPQDGEERQGLLDRLDSYYAEGVPLPSYQNINGYRTLDEKTLYNIEEHEGRIVLQYRVDYTNVTVEEGEKEGSKKESEGEETKHSKSALLNLPIQAEQRQYSVVEPPYFTHIPSLNGEGEKIQDSMKGQEEVNTQDVQEVKAWLQEFFTDYAGGEPKDMEYVMDDPQTLGGLQSFVSLDDPTIYQEGEQQYTVKTGATFEDEDIKSRHQQRFTLEIVKKDGRFYVNEFTNTLGGQS
ncbi:conjugal transfer protein [Halobacillus sp. Marseille-Q1614]|uniref:conjugal transfer protein n=1 Tax=Halobacillus sp. Marseille-Q1614 TaxID=2709134 RepID=UPI00156F5246|nr:conjugal transfer protein [Halobacillus sp. Marseille-Q1614]